MFDSLILLPLLFVQLVAALSSPPKGALVVSKNPSAGQFGTIQAAISALSGRTTSEQVVFIQPGTYYEQVTIPRLHGPLKVYGSSVNEKSYGSNQVTIIHTASNAQGLSDDETGTVRNFSPGSSIYNLNIVNAYGRGAPAVALSAQAEKQGYYGVSLKGYQDTLLAEKGTQFYAASYIEGAIDFIFGQRAAAFIQNCDVGVVGRGYLTASGRDTDTNPSWYVINDSRIRGVEGLSPPAGSVALGRPWGDHARVVVQNTQLGEIISPAGWAEWSKGDARTAHVVFAEYGNTGSGAAGQRASFSSKLTSPVTLDDVLGRDHGTWVDSRYL